MTPETSYRLIPLTQGQFAKVSLHRFEELNQWKWCAQWQPQAQTYYAVRATEHGPLLLHRFILGLDFGDPRQGDHKNHNTLDCTDDNLRIATPSQNHQNRGRQINNKSGYKGVSFHNRKWRATIRIKGEYFHLGYYATAEEAHAAYCEAAKRLHGEFSHF